MSKTVLVAQIARQLLEYYPTAWKASELACSVGGNPSLRSVQRALRIMRIAGLVEIHHRAYRIHSNLIQQIYAAQWSVRQEQEKATWLEKQQTN